MSAPVTYVECQFRITITNDQRYVAPNPYNYDYVNECEIPIPTEYKWTTRILEVNVAGTSLQECEEYARECVTDVLDTEKVSITRVECIEQNTVQY
jgi:hypothetical protein